MKFAIITHAVHKKVNNTLFAYEPYVREMNLWTKYVEEVKIVSPISLEKVSAIEEKYNHKSVVILKIPSFHLLNFWNTIKSFFLIPVIVFKIFKVMFWADHIHLRCPGNIGLLGCIVQILFPNKPKTVKFAGNWDPKSKQPLSYKLQKWIVSNTFLTKNCKVLVYGNWQKQSKNIVPFFTASYNKEEIEPVLEKKLDSVIKFIFVGSFSKGKQPLLTVKIIHKLFLNGYNIQLNMYGEGPELDKVSAYIIKNNLQNCVFLNGNQPKNIVKKAYKKSHFLLFISKSEGWPKVVAEAMFWRCLPIASNVSCVKDMLDNGKRGVLIDLNINENLLSTKIENIINNSIEYQKKVLLAQNWSHNFTLNKFKAEIENIINE